MRIIFMGTPDFAVPYLDAIHRSHHQLLAVVTQPDRPRGRGMRTSASPVKRWALDRDVPVLQPTRLDEPDFLTKVAAMEPDAAVVVAYGRIITSALLQLPRHGCINVHPSLLPRHRGASPIQAAILAGDRETGVSTMYLDEGLDTGDIILQRKITITPDDTAETLGRRLILIGVPLLMDTLQQVEEGRAPRVPQDEAGASYAPRLEKEDAALDWTANAVQLDRIVRAFTPVPGAYTRWKGRRLRVWAAKPMAEDDAPANVTPGTILSVDRSGIAVRAGEGVLLLQEVQPENGRRMHAFDYANGQRLEAGVRLDPALP